MANTCTRCLLAKASRTVCVLGTGPQPNDVMFFGEALGAREEIVGRPFVGDAGRILDQLLLEAGVPREQIFVTNICRCRPPANRTPTSEEVDACKFWTMKELALTKPKVVVALGASAAKALTGFEKIADNRGKLFHLSYEYRSDAQVLITYHPAAILHQGEQRGKAIRDAIAADIKLALKVARGADDNTEIVLGLDQRAAAVALKSLSQCEVLACDCEWEVFERGGMWPWSKRNGRSPQIVAVALAGMVDGKILSCSVPADGRAYEVALKLLSRIPSIYHNAPADLAWLMSAAVEPKLAGDTLLLASLLNIEHSLKLSVLAGIFTDVMPGWKADVEDAGRGRKKEAQLLGRKPVTTDEWQRLLLANARDAAATLPLHDKLVKYAFEQGRGKVLLLYHELLKATVTLTRASLTGVPLDGELLAKLEEKAAERIAQLKQQIAVELGVPGFAVGSPNSTIEVALALEKRFGISFPKTAKLQRPSIKLDALTPHLHYPVVADLVTLSHTQKLEGTYFSPWLELLSHQGDGRLHTAYKLWASAHGRSSAEQDMGGTLQQFPRDKRVRKLVRAREGWKILVADYSQMELRIAAWLANEQTMLRFFREGRDLHIITAAWMKALKAARKLQQFLVEVDDWSAAVTPEERQGAKPFNFGLLYGGSEQVVIDVGRKEYGVVLSREDAKVGRDGFFILYPGLLRWHRSFWAELKRGYGETPFYRRRFVSAMPSEDSQAILRKLINLPVQGTASDIGLIALADIDYKLQVSALNQHALILGFIHDAALMEVREGYVEVVAKIVKHSMEHPPLEPLGVELTVPLEVEIKIGDTWADAAKISL